MAPDEDVMRIIWVALAVVLAAGEIALPGLVLLPFAIGAAAAAIAAFAGAPVAAQLGVLLIVSGVAFAALRPWGRRLNRMGITDGIGSNRLVNQMATVLEPVSANDTGLVRVDREEWRAESVDGRALEVGTVVRVVEVRGTRVVVAVDPVVPTDPPSHGGAAK